MKIIIDVPADRLDETWEIVRKEADRLASYDRIGWGWTFGKCENGHTPFFVRRIKDGLSIRFNRDLLKVLADD